jgi:hypothetical protein
MSILLRLRPPIAPDRVFQNREHEPALGLALEQLLLVVELGGKELLDLKRRGPVG